jgi:PAS domain S-box-containing protein
LSSDGKNPGNTDPQPSSSILEQVDDYFFTVDHEWRLTFLNRPYQRALGLSAESVLGRVLWDLVPQYLGTEYEESFRRVMRERQTDRFEAGSGVSDRWFRTHVYPLDSGLAVFASDITERHRIQEELRAAHAEAEAASRTKDEFLATMSHELRTPLNAILGWVHILRNGSPDAEVLRRGLETIERSSRAQARLIDDLLDVARIISGKMHLDIHRTDPAEVIEAALAMVAPAAEARQITLEKRLDAAVGPILADAGRLQQVVWNLLANAVKFTPQGGRVEVRLERTPQGLEICVADNGKGIDPEFLPHVFDLFRQADASTSRRHGGLGLGLSLVREIVEMHGGTVTVESGGADKGAAFTVALPCRDKRA